MIDEKGIIKQPKSKEEFEAIIKSGKPVLVDFSAAWCGPCQMMGPMLEEMTTSYKNINDVEIVKVDIDELKEVATELGIMSVPTFKLYNKKGEITETMVGMRPTDEFEKKLDLLLK